MEQPRARAVAVSTRSLRITAKLGSPKFDASTSTSLHTYRAISASENPRDRRRGSEIEPVLQPRIKIHRYPKFTRGPHRPSSRRVRGRLTVSELHIPAKLTTRIRRGISGEVCTHQLLSTIKVSPSSW